MKKPNDSANTDEPKRRVGRPTTWTTKIDAPEAALALYEIVASLQHSDAFRTCHPYQGAKDKHSGVPMFKFEGRVTSLPYVICSFMGLEYGKRTCSTPGCVNPFHYVPPSERISSDLNHFQPPNAVGDDWHDLVDYYVEELGHPLSFLALRPVIPAEDITDSNLRTAITEYHTRKGRA